MEYKGKIIPKFKPCDYVVNRNTGDMAIIDKITKKGYYHFKVYYGNMFRELKDVKNPLYDLQIHYQKFYDLCNDEEKNKLDEIIKNYGMVLNVRDIPKMINHVINPPVE